MFRTVILSVIIFIILTTPCLSDHFQSTGTIDAYFSPNGGAAEVIVKEINAAKSSRANYAVIKIFFYPIWR